MEEYPSAPPVSPIIKRKPAFWKAGLLLFLLVLITLGVLFYFDLPPFKSSQPNIKPTITPADSSKTFQYDVAKAEKLLTQYIKDTVRPELLPANMEIKQNQNFIGPSVNPYEFGWNYNSSKATISAILNYKKDTNDITLMSILIGVKQPNKVSTPTFSLANSLLSQYFNRPIRLNAKDCGEYESASRSYCGKFDIKSNGKIDYVLEGGFPANSTFNFYAISCFIPKDSEYFKIQEHCVFP